MLFDDGEMHGRAPMIRPIHPRVQIGARLNHLPNHGRLSQRDGREERVLRAVRKEVARDFGVVGVVETHGPSDRVQLVVGARTDRIGTVFDEQPDDGEIAALGGKVNGERVVSLIPDVRVGAAIEQHFHHRFVADAEM